MIYANTELYVDKNDQIGVLTRTGPFNYNIFLQTADPNDLSINLDRRLIEFYLNHPKGCSYEQWDELMEECGYPSLLRQECPELFESDDANDLYERSIMSKTIVSGFQLWWIPTGKMFRIVHKEIYQMGQFIEIRQCVEVYDESDFIRT